MSTGSGLKQSILSLLPESLARDVGDSIDRAIQGYFEDMDLVSRQEFDIQKKVLSKTRAKLEQLERELAVLQDK